MKRLIPLFFIVTCLVLAVLACGVCGQTSTTAPEPLPTDVPTGAPPPAEPPAPTDTAPPSPAVTETPSPAQPAGDAERGATLYAGNACAACHGQSGEGGLATKPLNTGEYHSSRSDDAIFGSIAQGVAGTLMMAWGEEQGGTLTTAEIWDLVAFIRSLQ